MKTIIIFAVLAVGIYYTVKAIKFLKKIDWEIFFSTKEKYIRDKRIYLKKE